MEVKTTNLGTVSQTPPHGLAPQYGGNFREVLVSLNGGVVDHDPKAFASKISYRVQPKETLYGIARKELINSGRNASPGASMAYALKIAKDNRIQNTDCIYAGQRLVLDGINSAAQAHRPSPLLAENNASNRAGTDTQKLTNLAEEEKSSDLDWKIASMKTDQAGYGSQDPAELTTLFPNQNIAERPFPLASNNVLVRDLELYEQNAENIPISGNSSATTSALIYKGVVGKILDGLPLESSTRTALQQANTVISNSYTGRAIGALTGIGAPILGVAGFLWGLFAAKQIGSPSSAENKAGD